MKKWYIELFVDNGQGGVYHPCGTDYAMIYDDLKTLRGVLNRMKKWSWKHEKEIVGVKIYTYTDLYEDDTYELQYVNGKVSCRF